MDNILNVNIIRHTREFDSMWRFYHELLGMAVVRAWDEPGNRGGFLTFGSQTNHTTIEILQIGTEAVPGVRPVNIVLSVEVTDVDTWQAELIRRGITIARGLEDAPWGHRSFGIDDPEGFRIWYYQDLNRKG